MIKCSLKADKFIQTSFRNLLLKEFSDLGDTNLFNIALATGEALQNIVRYGYNFLEGMSVEMILVQAEETFVVEILDTAPPCPTESFMQQHFTPSDHGGMGLGIIKKLTQTFEITPLVKGNRTKLIFALERWQKVNIILYTKCSLNVLTIIKWQAMIYNKNFASNFNLCS